MAKAPKPTAPTSRPRGLEQLEALRDALPEAPYAARDAELEAVIAEDPDDRLGPPPFRRGLPALSATLSR